MMTQASLVCAMCSAPEPLVSSSGPKQLAKFLAVPFPENPILDSPLVSNKMFSAVKLRSSPNHFIMQFSEVWCCVVQNKTLQQWPILVKCSFKSSTFAEIYLCRMQQCASHALTWHLTVAGRFNRADVLCTLSSVQCAVYSLNCTLCNVHCKFYTLQCELWTVRSTLYTVQCALYIVHCILCTLHCTLCTAHYIFYTV